MVDRTVSKRKPKVWNCVLVLMAFSESIPAIREVKRDGSGLCLFPFTFHLDCVVPLTEGSTGSCVKQTPWAAWRHEVPGKGPAPHNHILCHTFILSNYRLSPDRFKLFISTNCPSLRSLVWFFAAPMEISKEKSRGRTTCRYNSTGNPPRGVKSRCAIILPGSMLQLWRTRKNSVSSLWRKDKKMA